MSLGHQKEIENHHSQRNFDVICAWWLHCKGLRIGCFIPDIEMLPTLGAPYPHRVSIRFATISCSILLALCQACRKDLVSIHDSSPRNGRVTVTYKPFRDGLHIPWQNLLLFMALWYIQIIQYMFMIWLSFTVSNVLFTILIYAIPGKLSTP